MYTNVFFLIFFKLKEEPGKTSLEEEEEDEEDNDIANIIKASHMVSLCAKCVMQLHSCLYVNHPSPPISLPRTATDEALKWRILMPTENR